MKKHLLILSAACLSLSSCVPISYFGDKFAPTASVDIYYSKHDVKRDYKVIGHLSCPNAGQQFVKDKLAAYAKTIGADAVVILGTEATRDNQAAVINADALKYN